MPQANLWFASPFKDWIGQRTITLTWEGILTLRDLWERLAAEYPKLRANLPRQGLQEQAMENLVVVIVDGDILILDSVIRDGAKVDVLTPLSGGSGWRPQVGPGRMGAPHVASTSDIRDDPAIPAASPSSPAQGRPRVAHTRCSTRRSRP